MKKIITLGIAAMLLIPALHGQMHLFLEEQEIAYDDSKLKAWVMPVTNNLEEALKDLDDYIKDRSNIRMKKDGKEVLVAEKVSLPAIAKKRGDLIGYGYITDSYYAIAIIFRMGYDISLNSEEYGEEMENFHTYARQFMSYHYEQAYDRRMDAIDDEIKDLEKEKDKHQKDIDSMTKRIGNINGRIEKETDEFKADEMRTEITTLEADIESLQNMIPDLDSRLEELHARKDQLNTEAHTYLGTIGSL
jgi:peptidoglycan hydrolase CwlO-like protein